MKNETAVQNVKIMYILNLVGIAVGITPIIAVIMAYMNKGEGSEWLESHHQYVIRTFWISLVTAIIGSILIVILIGFFVLIALVIWTIIRNLKGMQALDKEEAIADPTTFTW